MPMYAPPSPPTNLPHTMPRRHPYLPTPVVPQQPPRTITPMPGYISDRQRAAKRDQRVSDAQDERLESITLASTTRHSMDRQAEQQLTKPPARKRKVSLRSIRKD
jgi:hypothetical protein